ncbi:DUF4169 family protein [Agrobacterium vitis]|uniref:DUF4169 family protein n=1 Tax=Agrobacterium vitis TaxID=373 RepID=UPI0015741EE8|nr:DUF4169 family protein [Agrobacterium vitis]NSZ17204.1 DUF4169 family protein [Agrobacterium vitis]QZO02927.1 DUF4169 family protein [Agrobacterium vitis]UJL88051.1 DUF4169 family protein [Agrobacterium vitis]
MSGEIVNLRQVRKAKARTEKEKIADQNRVSFGRSKAEKNLTSALNDKARAALDNSKLEPKPTSPAPDEQG